MAILLLLPVSPLLSRYAQVNQEPLVKAKIMQSENRPATGAIVYVYSYASDEFVNEGTTDDSGHVAFFYEPHDLTAPLFDIHYYLIAFGRDGSMAHYHWSATYVDYRLLRTEVIELVLKHFGDNETSKPIGIKMHPIKLREDYFYNQPTVVGEVHATSGMNSAFTYATQSGTTIDVMTKFSGPEGTDWFISGSTTTRSGWTVTWPPVENGANETVSYFHYVEEYWSSETREWSVFYAYQYNGGAIWGSSKSGDNAPWQDVEAGHHGTWVKYLPSSAARHSMENGYRYGFGATVGGVTFGSTTSYDQKTEIEFKFGNEHPLYYLYDGGTNPSWQVIYATYNDNSQPVTQGSCGGCCTYPKPM